MSRILDLPVLDRGTDRAVPAWVYDKNTRPGSDWELRPLQALALHEFHEASGLLGNIVVGEGKTLMTGLLPNMVHLPEGRDAHLFVPASAVDKTYRELAEYDQHFFISRRLWVHSYGKLSNVKTGPDLLDQLQPGALLFDEVHKLANVNSVSWLRVMRWFEQNPETFFAGITGTLMKTKIEDYAHLAALALRDQSPVPMDWDALQPWSATIGEDTAVSFARNRDWTSMQPLVDNFTEKPVDLLSVKRPERKELVREALRNRLDTCRGIVLSKRQSTEVPLTIEVLDTEMPAAVEDSIENLLEAWVRPDGEYLSSGLEVQAVGLQLSQGFHYYWDWPDNKPDTDWLEARGAFNKAVGQITRRKQRGLDSPGQVYKKIRQTGALVALVDLAIRNQEFSQVVLHGLAPRGGMTPALHHALKHGDLSLNQKEEARLRWSKEATYPTVSFLTVDVWDALEDWLDERHKPQPPTATAWIDYWLVHEIMRRLDESEEPTLVWYAHKAMADALSLAGMEVCRPKEDPDATRPRHLAVSIKSHNTGLNLQSWHKSIVVCPPSSAVEWEQMVGRTHRQHQKRPVEFLVYGHTQFMKAALTKARRRAKSIQQTKGLPQKLCVAEWSGLNPEAD